jgi:hypothetical protein
VDVGKVQRKRSMQTYVARQGIQQYVSRLLISASTLEYELNNCNSALPKTKTFPPRSFSVPSGPWHDRA